MNELLTFVTNNGIAVVLMFYFLRNNYRGMIDLIKQNSLLITEIKEIKLWQKETISVIQKCNKLQKIGRN